MVKKMIMMVMTVISDTLGMIKNVMIMNMEKMNGNDREYDEDDQEYDDDDQECNDVDDDDDRLIMIMIKMDCKMIEMIMLMRKARWKIIQYIDHSCFILAVFFG